MATVRASKKDNSGRLYSGGGPRPDHNECKQKEAKERDAEWAKKTPKEQLAELDLRPGESKRQRARILAQIEKANKPRMVAKSNDENETTHLKAKDRRAQEQKVRPSK